MNTVRVRDLEHMSWYAREKFAARMHAQVPVPAYYGWPHVWDDTDRACKRRREILLEALDGWRMTR